MEATLLNAIRNLETTVASLTERVEQKELLLTSLEQDVRKMVEQMRKKESDDDPDVAQELGACESPLVLQFLRRLEVQVQTDERRLNNQTQAVQTIATVIQSVANVMDMHDECVEGIRSQSFGNRQGTQNGVRGSGSLAPRPDNMPLPFQEEPLPLPSEASERVGSRHLGQPSARPNHSGHVMPLDMNLTRRAEGSMSAASGSSTDQGRTAISSGPEVEESMCFSPVQVMDPRDRVSTEREQFPSLQKDGEQISEGALLHPDRCKPCSFYCFSKRGCKKGPHCEYCHMLHISRNSLRSNSSNNSTFPTPPPASMRLPPSTLAIRRKR